MRRNTPIKNNLYNEMLKTVNSENNVCSSDSNIHPFGIIHKLWKEGAFDDYSKNHFIIRALDQDVEYFDKFFKEHYIKTCYATSFYKETSDFSGTFVVNLENRFRSLVMKFGYDNIFRFVRDKLSAGKNHYDEDSFFQSLSEVHILSFFCQFGSMKPIRKEPLEIDDSGKFKCVSEPVRIRTYLYEPPLNGKKCPEARFIYDDGTILDLEIKTPKFCDQIEVGKPVLMPGVLLSKDGISELKKICNDSGIICLLPNVKKIKDFLNSAADKFLEPKSCKYINLLCINWSGAKIDKNDINEPLVILSNLKNGLLIHPEIAYKCDIKEESLSKVSAILLYKLDIGSLLFSDFRFNYADCNALILLNKNSKYLNEDSIYRIFGLKCKYPEECNVDVDLYINKCCYYDNQLRVLPLVQTVINEFKLL